MLLSKNEYIIIVLYIYRCYNIDGEERVYASLNIICYKGFHLLWAYAVALPSLIVWGLGIPFFAFILLNKEKGRLNTTAIKEKFGFLYNGYK